MSDPRAVGLVIVGGGGHARSVADAAARAGIAVLAVVDPSAPTGWDLPVVAAAAELGPAARAAAFTVAIGNNSVRMRETDALAGDGVTAADAVIASTATVGSPLGVGTQVLEHAHVGPGATIGRAVIINTAAVVEHDGVVEDGVHVAPGARLLGGVKVGAGAMIGSGATVLPFVVVGAGAVVGAGSVVNRDVPAGAVVSGVPARQHRSAGQASTSA